MPVYIIYDPTKTDSDRFKVWDESEVGDMNQDALEGAIKEKLGVDPRFISPVPITAANEHDTIYNYKPDYPNPAPTARWTTILFYTKDPNMSRLRDELGLDRFFYIGRMRFAEVDLSTDADVFQILTGATPGKDGELMVFDPDMKRFALYKPGSVLPGIDRVARPLAELSHAEFVAWLQTNAVEPPPRLPLSSEFAWQTLLNLSAGR